MSNPTVVWADGERNCFKRLAGDAQLAEDEGASADPSGPSSEMLGMDGARAAQSVEALAGLKDDVDKFNPII